jgi:polyisoprenoid-binding protein YceI
VATLPDSRTTWTIDPAHGTIGFAVKQRMVTTVRGRFRGICGMIRLDQSHPRDARRPR